MLLGNYTIINKNPSRFLGCLGESGVPSACNTSGAQRNRRWGCENLGHSEVAGMPYGVRPPYCWCLPQAGGALVCHAGVTCAAASRAPSTLGMFLTTTATPVGIGAGITQATGYMPMLAGAHATAGCSVTKATIDGLVDASAHASCGCSVAAAATGEAPISADVSVGVEVSQATIEGGVALGSSVAVGCGITQATGDLLAYMTADIDAGAAMSGAVIGVWPMAVSVDVGAAVAAGIDAPGFMAADIPASCDVSGSIDAPAFMSANIRSYSDLTAEGVRDAVWNATAASFDGTGTMGRLVNASGGGSDPETIAAAVWAALKSANVDTGSMGKVLAELHDLMGLDSGAPLVVTPTTRTAGGIEQAISSEGETVTVTRQ